MMSETGTSVFVPAPGDKVTSPTGPSNGNNGGMTTTGNACTNGNDLEVMRDKLELFKDWTVHKFKTTKQSVYEHLGKIERTVDKDMESQVDALKDLHKRYLEVLAHSREFHSHLHNMTETQKRLAESLYQLSLKEADIQMDCSSNAESLRAVSFNGEVLEKSLNYFLSSMGTLCEKTIVDTLQTAEQQEAARIEYDCYRHELTLRQQQHPPASTATMIAAESRCAEFKSKYEGLKRDVRVKMQLLERNRLSVVRKQLMLFCSAMNAYYSGNASTLQNTLTQLSSLEMDMARPGLSFLEQ